MWATQRNAKFEDQDCVPRNILGKDDGELVAEFMRYFVLEERKENGVLELLEAFSVD